MDNKTLKEILEKHKKWLNDEEGGVRADLRHMDLRGTDFTYTNLKHADLSNSDLSGLDLNHTNLKHADLSNSDLRGTDLKHADLSNSDLSNSDLRGTDSTYADLRGANLRGADLRGANLDFSVLPLWCGSLDMIVDKRIACQIAYHFCRLDCDDAEFIAARNAIIDFANQFHRVNECRKLEKIEIDGGR